MSELIEQLGAIELSMHLHEGQERAWGSRARFVAVVAGTQGGKTCFAMPWLLREIEKRGPGDYLFVTPTFPLLELKALPLFRNLFEQQLELGKFTASPVRRFTFSPSGSKGLFQSRHDPQAPPTRVLFGYAAEPESLESATAKAAVCDEAGQKKFKQGSWEAILRRLSLHRGRALITTSVYALNWLKTRYDAWRAGDRDWEFINFASNMNPAFPQEEFERARRDLPRWKFDMLYRGLFTRPAGVIYDCFDELVHKVPRFAIPRTWKRYLGLDFGGVNTVGVLIAEEPRTRRRFVYRTYHARGRTAKEHVQALLEDEPGRPWAVGGAASEEHWRREFGAAGLAVRKPPIADVEIGIQRVYGEFKHEQLFVFEDLPELLEDLLTYSRVLDERGEPTDEIEDKSDHHYADALRYVISHLARSARGVSAGQAVRVTADARRIKSGWATG